MDEDGVPDDQHPGASAARAVGGGEDSAHAGASAHDGGALSTADVHSPIRMTELAACAPSTASTSANPPSLVRQPTPAQTGDFDS